ncbi:MAG: hypothetical protein KME10_08385 [Plectolyngbya sp. WJT66-NPBG17]|jgi:hypothetical protein|nr:hypothetical protein [Plectolyngbya sp. WJT66-NPBG17]
MAGSTDQISQRLAALDRQIETMGDTFTETYRGYLKQLGQTVRQQIILSCYRICTENYPKRFLALSLSQRQKLQEDLQSLARQTEIDLSDVLYPIEQTKIDPEPEDLPDELEALLAGTEPELPDEPTLTPLEALTIWQEQIERSIFKTLKSASSNANRLLQEAEILPKRIPQAVLDAAAKESSDSGASNLLNVLVSASERSSDSESPPPALSALIHIVAVNLRLSEIEFNDPAVSTWRGKLRELKQQFQTLARDYQKKRREQSIAEAQLAWKSTWTKDEA